MYQISRFCRSQVTRLVRNVEYKADESIRFDVAPLIVSESFFSTWIMKRKE